MKYHALAPVLLHNKSGDGIRLTFKKDMLFKAGDELVVCPSQYISEGFVSNSANPLKYND